MVEPGAIVLPCDGRGQLDKLLLVEVPTELIKQFVRYFNGRVGDGVSISNDQLLNIRERLTMGGITEGREFLFREALLSADGRPDIHSERASDATRNLDAGQRFE